jgi:hypothetical protein
VNGLSREFNSKNFSLLVPQLTDLGSAVGPEECHHTFMNMKDTEVVLHETILLPVLFLAREAGGPHQREIDTLFFYPNQRCIGERL